MKQVLGDLLIEYRRVHIYCTLFHSMGMNVWKKNSGNQKSCKQAAVTLNKMQKYRDALE
jgi:hypothetical protein